MRTTILLRASLADWGGMVNEIVRDLAAGYDDPGNRYPPFRNFDPYAGHSVASGVQQFADGVNQESSSEAINASYGMILWALASGDDALLARAIYAYTSEVDAGHLPLAHYNCARL